MRYDRRMTRPNLFGQERAALAGALHELGEPAYRTSQVYSWLYNKRARSFAEMTNVGKDLRQRLGEAWDLRWPEVQERSLSYDGTRKYLFRLDDGATIESVSIPEESRRTICISTQAGCPLKCAFCLTGIAGYKRNLKTWEILGQVATVMAETPATPVPWNVVVMGMGEPLLNYDATVSALRVLMDPEGYAVAPRRLTLSTVGILPALEKLMVDAPNTALRRALMPIEEKYALADVVEAALRYPIPQGGLVTFEYVLLRGVNDTALHARELVRLLAGRRVKVNLIPLNATPEIPFGVPTPEAVDAFCQVLARAHVVVSVRRPRGQDILAACGQLHLKRAEEAPLSVQP